MTIDMPTKAYMQRPHVQWKHVDGPCMSWCGHMHWLTWGERARLWLGLTTIDEIARERWPYTAARRDEILKR